MKECEFCDNEESVLDAFGFFLCRNVLHPIRGREI
jgi:hypothetical protein